MPTRQLQVLAALVLVVASCAGGDDGGVATTAAVGTSAPGTTFATTSTIAAAATTTGIPVTTLALGEMAIAWSPAPFTVSLPPEWGRGRHSQVATTLSHDGSTVVITSEGAETVDDWIEELTTNPELDAGEPVPFEIDGATGYALDVGISDQATVNPVCGTACFIMSFDTGWAIVPNMPHRIWVVDAGGETVLIATEATEDEFAGWTAEVEDVLSTITWAE